MAMRNALLVALTVSAAFLGGYRLAAYLRSPLTLEIQCARPAYRIRIVPRPAPQPAAVLTGTRT